MHERLKFASEIVTRLAAAGVKPLPAYDVDSDMLIVPAVDDTITHILLSRFFERHQSAMHADAKEEVLDDFVRVWLNGSFATIVPQPHRWLPLLRSRWHFEVSRVRLGETPLSRELQQAGLFAYELITDDLALAVAEDLGESYRFLSPLDLEQAGLTLEQALQRAFANLPPASGPGLSGPPFEEMRGLAWLPTGELNEHCATRLLDTAAIRKLPVRGQHVAFVPHTHVLWISGTYQHSEVRMLAELALQECDNPPGKPLLAGPLVLDEAGRWQPWHPAPTHPNYWNVKRLHTLGNEELYRLQKEVLDQRPGGPHPPFVASYRAIETGDEGSGRLYSYCVFTTTISLLPRTEYVLLMPTINDAELAANPGAEPRFGPSLVLTWESFAAFQGENLKPQGMYPERYYIDQFPDDVEWKALQPEQQKVAPDFLETVLSPDFRNDRAPTTKQPPAPRPAPAQPPSARAQPPSANWTLAIMAGIVVAPALLILTVVLMSYMFAWVPTGAAQIVPPPGPPPPVYMPPPNFTPSRLETPEETQVFADGEFQSMDGPLSLPTLEGTIPSIGVEKFANENATAASPDEWGDIQFSSRSPDGEPLVGLRIIKGANWGGAVQALQPIYQGDDRYFLGNWCGAPGGKQQAQSIADPDYAVGAIEVHQGLVVNAIRIEYWRMTQGKLDPSDKYVTDWYGCQGGGKLPPLSSEGRLIIGISGTYQDDLQELHIIRPTER